MALSVQFLNRLNDALMRRNIAAGFKLLDSIRHWDNLSASDPLVTSLLVEVAQWVSLGYRDYPFFERLMVRFSKVDRKLLPFESYVRLRFAEGQLAFFADDLASTVSIFNFILQVEEGILPPQLVMVAHYWKARAHRRRNEYDAALFHTLAAKSLATELDLPKYVATTKIQESRMLFSQGHRKDLFRILDEAEEELRSTDDALNLGDIELSRGRFVRRLGDYPKALRHFERAIEIYSARIPGRVNVARALVNAAYVKRLIALDLKRRQSSGRALAADNARFLEVCREALALLERASEIYARLRHQPGTGSVLVNSGYLHLDIGDIDQAENDAAQAYTLGQQKGDDALLARARILQATIQNDRAEEQLGDPEEVTTCAYNAQSYAEEAIILAKRTDNVRILAGAYVVRGFIAASDFFADWEKAMYFATLTGDLLGKDDLDHLSKQLALLKTKILHATSINETLRGWSEGVTGEKSFQQITEEFAELVIPKVWEKQDRKIARVVEVLCISAKKVRRILKNRGFLEQK
jgi:tetratricopeptide (TPR) repeat protein